MNKLRTSGTSSKKGFTLFEIVMAIVIVGILATAGTLAFNNVRGGALDSAKTRIANELTEVAEMLHAQGEDQTGYADVEEAIDAMVAGLNVEINAGGETMWVGYEGAEDPNPAAYTLVDATEDTPCQFIPILDQRNVPATED